MVREFYGATAAAEHAINEMLSLPATGKEQDWEFELSDPARVDEMLNAASNSDLSYDEKCALALLTIASIEELVEMGESTQDFIERAHIIMRQSTEIRDAMVFYWIEQNRASDAETVKRILIG